MSCREVALVVIAFIKAHQIFSETLFFTEGCVYIMLTETVKSSMFLTVVALKT